MIIFEEVAIQIADAAGPIVKVFVAVGVTLPTVSIAIVHILTLGITHFAHCFVGAGDAASRTRAACIVCEEVASQVTDPASPIVKVFFAVGVTLSAGPISIVHVLIASITSFTRCRIRASNAPGYTRLALVIFDKVSIRITNAAGPIVEVLVAVRVTLSAG